MRKWMTILIIALWQLHLASQTSYEFDGQASMISSFSPQSDRPFFVGFRYIPEFTLTAPLSENRAFDFEAAVNLDASVFPGKNVGEHMYGNISPYRLWARYTAKKVEVRVGLQKIDFGSATLLRPMQWFNQIDPRDPLQLTNGVYGALGRYYFSNNANLWLWTLYGNSRQRGFDIIETNPNAPEMGGRFQYPVPKGELALSYHYRSASTENLPFLTMYSHIPENRIGLDGKWDLGVGLWFEASTTHKSRDVSVFTNQTFLNLGVDYTFGLGNGLNIMLENLVLGYSEEVLGFEQKNIFSALTASYPLSFYDNVSAFVYYNWTGRSTTVFLNYHHQFGDFSTYVMAYYNPEFQGGIQQNELVNNFSGPGIRIMAVYNH